MKTLSKIGALIVFYYFLLPLFKSADNLKSEEIVHFVVEETAFGAGSPDKFIYCKINFYGSTYSPLNWVYIYASQLRTSFEISVNIVGY
jgi:hypothetical protein